MLAQRLTSQGLSGPPLESAEAVVGRLLAVQAQDGRGMRLAIRPRSEGVTAANVDRALTEERSLIVSWLNRGTLHLVGRDEYPWLHALTTPRIAKSNRTRLAEEGVSPAQAELGARTINQALAGGPMARKQLREKLDSAGVPTDGQALNHVLLFTCITGSIIRGPVAGNQQLFVLAEDWLGPLPAVDPEVALAELARRYLAGHSPATDRDLARWAGVTLGQARKGMAAIAGELTEADSMVSLKDRTAEPALPLPHPRLLGPFDPVLHGWTSREFLIPSSEERSVVTTNGIFRPTILVDGRVAGTWTMPGGTVQLAPFGDLDPAIESAVAVEADAVAAYLGSGARA